MTNLYNPLTICPDCDKKITCHAEEKEVVKCSCGKEIKKVIHTINGAELSRDRESGCYILKFPKYNETDEFPDWDTLKLKLDELALHTPREV